MVNPKRILVIKLKHIGDGLLTTPTIHALKGAYPSSRIFALVPEGTEEVLTGNPDLADVLTFKKGKGLFSRISSEWRLLKAVRRVKPDLVVEMGKGDREAILGVLSGARWRVGYDPLGSGFLGRRSLLTHLTPYDGRKHVVESDLDLCRLLGIEPQDKALRLFIPEEASERVEHLLWQAGVLADDLLVCIHPVSRWFFKNWTAHGFAEVMDYLSSEYGARVAVTSGPADREVAKARGIMALSKAPTIDLAGRLSLKELAALIKKACLFVGVDSAPIHIASAVGTPVIALFGPSGEHNWGPWGEGHIVLSTPLPCRPCGQGGCHDTGRSLCLELLDPQKVKTAIDLQLALHARSGTTQARGLSPLVKA